MVSLCRHSVNHLGVWFCLLSVSQAYVQFVVPGNTTATISSTYNNLGASKTVDGNFSQYAAACSHTADSGVTEAWLAVDLQTVRSVKSVKFWYRTDRAHMSTGRLKEYFILVSNVFTLAETRVCYTQPPGFINTSILEEDCQSTARYLWFYQNKTFDGGSPMLEICEVQVFGCETGFYGKNCSSTCSHCKNTKTCGIVTGHCDVQGCASSGFQAPSCTECSPGFYGADCDKVCSQACKLDNSCNRTTGFCLHGCDSGYIGDYCNYTCSSGTYGQNCNEPCGNCLNNTTCNRYNGTCPSGCNAGFEGHICKTPCNNGTFGRNCVLQCGHCLNGDPCNKTDGTCQNCTEGWGGELCNIALKQEQSVRFIVGSLAGVLAFVSSVLVAVFLIRESRKRKDTSKPEGTTSIPLI